MKINLVPQHRDDTLAVSRLGDVLLINRESFDFSPLGEGDTLPSSAISSPWFAGPVDRVNGELELTLLLPLPVNFSPEQAFPVPLIIASDGDVHFPQSLPEVTAQTFAQQEDTQ